MSKEPGVSANQRLLLAFLGKEEPTTAGHICGRTRLGHAEVREALGTGRIEVRDTGSKPLQYVLTARGFGLSKDSTAHANLRALDRQEHVGERRKRRR